MPAKPPRPPLPSLTLEDDGEAARIRDYARAKGLVQTAPPAPAEADRTPAPAEAGRAPAPAEAGRTPAPAPETAPPAPLPSSPPPRTHPGQRPSTTRTPAPASGPAVAVRPALPRPAPTRPWQAMFPDYLIDQLKLAAAEAGTAQKVIVLEALRAAGFHIEDIDLQDLRRR